ncbi:MAG: class I SAM-dependent methyltransferase [Patescibacteria group bacterium UBA2103]
MSYIGFPKELIPSLICQKCESALGLEVKQENKDRIVSGNLKCSKCEKTYAIRKGVVLFLEKEEVKSEIQKKEIEERDKQAQGYDKRLAPRYFREVVPTLKFLGDTSNKKLIEYACGTGRVTTEIKEGTHILAIDFSVESLEVLSSKIKPDSITGLVLADASKFKSANNFFDFALAAQFIEHLPSINDRKEFLLNVSNSIKKEAVFVSTVYYQDLRRKLKGLKPEGSHKDAIFFHYFSIKESKKEWSEYFKHVEVVPIDIELPLQARLSLSPEVSGFISERLQNIYPLNLFGHLLCVIANNK